MSEETVQMLNKELLELKKQEQHQMKNHGQSIRQLEEIVSKMLLVSSPFPTTERVLVLISVFFYSILFYSTLPSIKTVVMP